MARLPRLYAPHVPQLVQAEFAQPLAGASDPTPLTQLNRLQEWLQRDARELQVALHGWLLLNDRITLLATPPDRQALSRLMQALGRRMAAGIRHGRVYKGRYRSALIEPGRWVLPSLIWLETLPVQLHVVDQPSSWPWSSAAAHTGRATALAYLLSDHPDYWHTGNTPFDRQANYHKLLEQGLASSQIQRIEQALFGQWALADDDFLHALKTRATRRTSPAPRGRPRKTPLVSDAAESAP